MLIKDRVYRTCKYCSARKFVSAEVYGCDTCGKKIDMNSPKADYLRANVFQNDSQGSSEIVCCSWKCMVKALRKAKSDHFISLPFLHYDNTANGVQAKDFFALLKRADGDSRQQEGK